MKPWMMLLMVGGGAGTRSLMTQTFTSNATWVAPATTTRLETASGSGAAGTPPSGGTPDQHGWFTLFIDTFHRRDTGEPVQTSSQGPNVMDGSPMPDNYCDPQQFFTLEESSVYSDVTTCYSHLSVTVAGTPGTAPTTGANTTGFGQFFPGGTGGAASTVSFTAVPVTPNTGYPIVVPSGGSLTITWYQ